MEVIERFIFQAVAVLLFLATAIKIVVLDWKDLRRFLRQRKPSRPVVAGNIRGTRVEQAALGPGTRSGRTIKSR